MRNRMQRLPYLLFLLWAMLEFPMLSNASTLDFKPVSFTINKRLQERHFFSQSTGRRRVEISAPSILSSAPAASGSPTPSPAPLPAFFPSDPPVTVPYSPAPQSLIVPTGNCSFNFTNIQTTFYQTANDCSGPFAVYVGVAVCCPQFDSLLRIIQGQHMSATGDLGLNDTQAEYCLSETVDAFSASGTISLSTLCKVQPANLTVGSCPATTLAKFKQRVDTSALLQACQSIDPLKECSGKTCQYAIANATLDLAQGQNDAFDDCGSLVLSWLTSQFTPQQANFALRSLSSCAVNQVCPLTFTDTSSVARACNSPTPSNDTCCGALDEYVQHQLQTQMLITNAQAYKCANLLAANLQGQGVTSDIYALCKIDLRDFSLQAQGKEGCLLSSLPIEINITAGDPEFVCDLNDNINAQWPNNSNAFAPSPQPSKAHILYSGSWLKAISCALGSIVLSYNFF